MKYIYLKTISIQKIDGRNTIFSVIKLTNLHQIVNFIKAQSLIETSRIVISNENEYEINKKDALPEFYYDKKSKTDILTIKN